jgi:hypothetical protein
VASGFDVGTNRSQNAPVNPSIAWLREPVSTSLTLAWRLRLYVGCLLLVALSVPFLHLYLEVELSGLELLVHAADISLGTLALLVLAEGAVSIWQRGFTWRLQVSRLAMLGAVVVVAVAAIPMQFALHDVLPMTDGIRERHVDAGYGDMSLRVLPLVLLIGYVVGQAVREHGLRSQLEELRALNEQLAHPRPKPARPAQIDERVTFRHEGNDVLLDIRSIVWLEAEENYCRVHVREAEGPRQLLVRSTLSEALEKLPAPLFRRVHRSHGVSLAHVTEVRRAGRSCELVLGPEVVVPVSRARVAEVRAELEAFLAS